MCPLPEREPTPSVGISRADLGAVALLVLLVAAFFVDPLFRGRTWSLHDIEAQGYPFRHFFQEMVRDGRLDLWNPYTYGGMPFLGDLQNGVFYPLNWLNFALPLPRVVAWFVVLHFLLAGLGCQLWLRSLALRPASALGGAVFYAFSGLMVERIVHLPIMAAIALLPLVLFLTRRLVAGPTLFRSLTLGLGLSMVFLSGHPQYTMVAALAVGVYGGVSLGMAPGSRARRWRAAGGLVLALAFMLAVSAVQLLPALDFLGRTSRVGGLSLEDATSGSVGLQELALFLVPDRYGLPLEGGYQGGWYYWEVSFYVGVFPLLLVLAAVLLPRERPRGAWEACAALALFSLALALGRHTPFYQAMYALVPLFKSSRIPARYLALMLPALAFFVGQALQRLGGGDLEDRERRRLGFGLGVAGALFLASVPWVLAVPFTRGAGWYLATGAAGLALLGLRVGNALGPRVFQGLAGALLVVSAFSFGFRHLTTVDDAYCRRASALFEALGGRMPPTRILFRPPEEYINAANYPGTVGVSNLSGYYPVMLRDYAEYLHYADTGRRLGPEDERTLHRQSNLVDLAEPSRPMGRLLAAEYRYVFLPGRGFQVEPLPDSCPRAFLVHRASVLPDPEERLARLRSEAFDPEAEVVLEAGVPTGGTGGRALPGEEVRFVSFRPDRVELEVRAEAPGWLVLSEIHDPGWRVRVDGAERPALRADHVLRAVEVGPGDRRVVFTYEPASFRVGAFLSLLALAGYGVVALRARRRGGGYRPLIQRKASTASTVSAPRRPKMRSPVIEWTNLGV